MLTILPKNQSSQSNIVTQKVVHSLISHILKLGWSRNMVFEICEKASMMIPWWHLEFKDKKHCKSWFKSHSSYICFSTIISIIDFLKSSYGFSDLFTTAKLSLTFPSTFHGSSFLNTDNLAGDPHSGATSPTCLL